MPGECRVKLRSMLEQIALGMYDTYPSYGEYVFPPELRIPAAAALLRDLAHEQTEMTLELASALEACLEQETGGKRDE